MRIKSHAKRKVSGFFLIFFSFSPSYVKTISQIKKKLKYYFVKCIIIEKGGLGDAFFTVCRYH
ncbi:hypothetical protein ENLAB_16060 [Enterococcus innesii]|uniref:Uncharacterized protein n=1 Tax=Enterococcus innesii TaxID=2839759 RepID=A0ABN6NR63_9ENTE|nr:hypothetical protein ENLAB_16060 [Enterococcus innesii]